MININIYENSYRFVKGTFLCPNDTNPPMILFKGQDGKPQGVEVDLSIKNTLTRDPKTDKPKDPMEHYGQPIALALRSDRDLCEAIIFDPEGENPRLISK